MKKVLFIFLISLGLFLNVQAQIDQKAAFKIGKADSSLQNLFARYPDLEHLSIFYKNGKAVSLIIYNRTDLKRKNLSREFFDLNFEGDCYLLSKKYDKLVIPPPPELTMEYFPCADNKTFYESETILTNDSLFHRFNFYTYTDSIDLNLQEGTPHFPRYKGNITLLEKTLEQELRQQKKPAGAVADSVLILSGIVQRDGSLGKLTLQAGTRSLFSGWVSEILEKNAQSWRPALQGGRPVKSIIRFFVRLNQDKTFTVSTSGRY